MAKIFVTGGRGFTGNALVNRLVKQGHDLISMDLKEPENKVKGVRYVEASICDFGAVEKAMENVDFVFHIAAAFRKVSLSDKDYHDTNVMGTENILKSAMKNNVKKVIHCSTCGVHGDVEEIPADEDSPYNPGDYYQMTKVEGEKLAFRYSKKMPVSIIRPIGIYGPGDSRLKKIFAMVKNRRFIMLGNGSTFYHLGYIENLIDGFLLAMEKEQADGEAFLIGHEKFMTLNCMMKKIADSLEVPAPSMHLPYFPVHAASYACEAICRPLGIEPPIFPRRIEFYKKNRAFSIEKAKRLLGFRPKIGIDEGIKLTSEWYIKNGWI